MKGGGRVVWLLPLPCYAPPRWEGRQPSYFSLSFNCISLRHKQVFLSFAPLYLCVCALARLLFTVNYGILNQWSIVVLHQWPHTASCFHLFRLKLFLCTALAKHCFLPICCIKWYEKWNPNQSKSLNIKTINLRFGLFCHFVDNIIFKNFYFCDVVPKAFCWNTIILSNLEPHLIKPQDLNKR